MIEEDVVVTNAFMGLVHMQVCARSDLPVLTRM
jgi:hypothetical protein